MTGKIVDPKIQEMAKRLFDEHKDKGPMTFPWTVVAEWLGERMPGLKASGAIWVQIRALEHRLKQHGVTLVGDEKSALAVARDQHLAELRYRRPPGECVTCDANRNDSMMPSHTASDRCESGKRAHCTCDVCF